MRIGRADALIAFGVLTGIVAGVYGQMSTSGSPERPLDVFGIALIMTSALPLAVRRSRPATVGVITVGCALAYYACRYPGVFTAAPALMSVYTATSMGRRRLAIALAAALGVGIYGLIALSDVDPAPPGGLSLISGWLVAVMVVGETTRNRRAYLEEAERRAAEAERTREEAALRRAGEERLWIAQELHDSLTHSISVINVQVSVAAHLLDSDPERSREALAAIREAGRDAMYELRATLGVLRQGDPDDPGAGLARLPGLVARAEAVGLPVKVLVAGEPRDLPPVVDRAAYRITQEAFTNVLRHAGPASITLTTEYRPTTIVISVEDDGASDAGVVTQGMGLIGMRERAVAVGGSFTAGPRAGGGFAVRAELPLTGPFAAGSSVTGAPPSAGGPPPMPEPSGRGRR
ncbi:sensor histidine kinase [Streptosporangium longisporum]|uniref:sensor histidine kinase n=1 Tax=Streptosporangium longisporum TaxID=46187 RepID=UPI0031F0308C